MPAGFRADTDHLDRLARDLHAAGIDLAALDPAHAEAARLVTAAAAPPRRTGRLAAGVTATLAATGVTFASTARYWTFVHFGAPRANITARPFFTSAIRANTADLLAVYAAHARRTLDQIG